jgi:hypothetical protein
MLWGKPSLTQTQWLPKPATSQLPKWDVRFAHRAPQGEGFHGFHVGCMLALLRRFRIEDEAGLGGWTWEYAVA